MLNYMALYWPQGQKKEGYHQIWEANLQPLGLMFEHLLVTWGQTTSQTNPQSWPPSFFGLAPNVKGGLTFNTCFHNACKKGV
jgi:hypothetical protein